MAQIYAICWQVLSTAALAYWPIFVKRREATEVTVRMWWRLTGIFARGGGGRRAVPGAARAVGGDGAVGWPNRRIDLARSWDSEPCWWRRPCTYRPWCC